MANIVSNLKNSVFSLLEDKVPTLAAALAYYTVFAIGPLLLILISILGFFFGRSAIEGEIIAQISALTGRQTAGVIEAIIAGSQKQTTGVVSLVVGVALLILSASGVFGQLKTSLNLIWNVEPKPGRGIMGMIQERVLSFAMVVVIGFLLGVSLVATSAVAILNSYFSGILPIPAFLIETINIFISFWVILVLFALVYKVLPDVKLPWRMVWGGATLSSLLFTLGKSVIGIYIGNSAAQSTYGAASSLVVILLWVYYSGLILFLGAEYIKSSAHAQGKTLVPESYALKTKQIREDEADEEFSELEKYLVSVFGVYFSKLLTPVLEKIFKPKKKTFAQRVREKLNE